MWHWRARPRRHCCLRAVVCDAGNSEAWLRLAARVGHTEIVALPDGDETKITRRTAVEKAILLNPSSNGNSWVSLAECLNPDRTNARITAAANTFVVPHDVVLSHRKDRVPLRDAYSALACLERALSPHGLAVEAAPGHALQAHSRLRLERVLLAPPLHLFRAQAPAVLGLHFDRRRVGPFDVALFGHDAARDSGAAGVLNQDGRFLLGALVRDAVLGLMGAGDALNVDGRRFLLALFGHAPAGLAGASELLNASSRLDLGGRGVVRVEVGAGAAV